MEVENPLAFYDMATFTAVKSVTVQGPEQSTENSEIIRSN
jgi:hypothetical protein